MKVDSVKATGDEIKNKACRSYKKISVIRNILLFVFAIILFASVSASDIAVWQGQYFTGTTFNTGTYDFNFSVYDALTGGNTCYSNTTTLTTGNFGEWKTEQNGVGTNCDDATTNYYLEIRINNETQNPRRLIKSFSYLRQDSPVLFSEYNYSGTARWQFQNLNSENTSNSLFSVSNDLGYLFSFGITSSNYFSVPNNRSFANQPSIGQSSFNDMYFVNGRYTGFSWLNNPLNDSSNLVQYLMSLDSEGNLNASGNMTASYFIGDGSLLTGINSSSANLTNYALKNQSETFAGNVTANYGFFSFLGSLTNRIDKLWVQDIDISGNLTGITKEVFFQVVPSDTNFGDFITQSVASGGIWRFNFRAPDDFSSLTSLEVILIPAGTNSAAPVDLYSDYGSIGEPYNQHSESLSTTWNLGTANNIYAMNISGVFSNLTAGDFCGIQIDEGAFGSATHYLGIRLKYKT